MRSREGRRRQRTRRGCSNLGDITEPRGRIGLVLRVQHDTDLIHHDVPYLVVVRVQTKTAHRRRQNLDEQLTGNRRRQRRITRQRRARSIGQVLRKRLRAHRVTGVKTSRQTLQRPPRRPRPARLDSVNGLRAHARPRAQQRPAQASLLSTAAKQSAHRRRKPRSLGTLRLPRLIADHQTMTSAVSRHIPADDFGPTLRSVRTERRMSLRKLAGRLGMSYGYLGSLERGEKAPSARLAEQLVEVLQPGPDAAAVILSNGIAGVGRDRY